MILMEGGELLWLILIGVRMTELYAREICVNLSEMPLIMNWLRR